MRIYELDYAEIDLILILLLDCNLDEYYPEFIRLMAKKVYDKINNYSAKKISDICHSCPEAEGCRIFWSDCEYYHKEYGKENCL